VHRPDADAPEPAGARRFRGLPREAREFFRALEREPCPDTMPGGDRAAYAAHVLTPLKALVTDLRERLSDVRPPLGSEARAGASLDWPDGARSNPEDCPVRRIRFWDAGTDRERSPLLYATFTSGHIEVGALGDGLDRDAAERLAGPGGWTVEAAARTRVRRRIPWEPWIDEPGLLDELADDFRALLPVFDRMRAAAGGPVPVPGGAGTAPRER
jgi:hypothetical protein